MWGQLQVLNKSCFYSHPLNVHRKVSLPFHKYIAYLANLITIIQAGRGASWSQWPSHHVEDKGSIAVTAVRPGQKPLCKMLKPLT